MRLFISYARVDKPYCIQIVDLLDAHDVWYDQRLYVGQDWWKEILRRLDWCEGFVYLLSPDSVASPYCPKEYELAKMLGRPIFPIKIRETTLPPDMVGDIDTLQHIDLSKGIDQEAVKLLLNSIHIVERERQYGLNVSVTNIPNNQITPISTEPSNSTTVIRLAATAMENGRYDQAILLLKQAKANGYRSPYVDLNAILKEAEAALDRQTVQVEVEREYRQIVELVKVNATRGLGLEAFKAFRFDFPSYDPNNISQYLSAAERVLPTQIITNGKASAAHPQFVLPLLEWTNIPTGTVDVCYTTKSGAQQKKQVSVPNFRISKYPVTNAQYQAFIDDDDGYKNTDWWEYSPEALAYRLRHPEPAPSKFKGPERPREMVSWYDARAYCNWLAAHLNVQVTLPTAAQWQRAFQGDAGQMYPWGNKFEAERCNSAESGVKMTTIVTRYPQGASAFGVYDMAGNVWEWCLDSTPNDVVTAEANGSSAVEKRVVRGGSFMSSHQRALVDFYYDLNPESYHASIGFRLVQLV